MNFDMFAVDIDGSNLDRISWFNGEDGKQFDGFPLFSPDGRFLAFSSNRGDGPPRRPTCSSRSGSDRLAPRVSTRGAL
ncbi:MAG: hypothetical protein R3E96_13430 [Planctomycetota bacterium]